MQGATEGTGDSGSPTGRVDDVAAAAPPGYLPFGEVEARLAARRWQFRHDNTTVPLAPRPGEPVDVWATAGTVLPLDAARVLYTTDGTPPGPDAPAIAMAPEPVVWDTHAGYLRGWRATLPPQNAGAIVRYRIAGTAPGRGLARGELWAQDGQGFHFRDGEAGRITTFAYVVEPAGAVPDWAAGAVIYQIFLDRFHSGGDDGALAPGPGPGERHGGMLAGVRRSLDYLTQLGVTCLWLSPHCNSETSHRYDTIDLYGVDPALGSEDDLRSLVAAAHERGMRVILDLVPNHCSWRHPAFLAAQADRHAPTASWFTFERWPDRYRCFLGTVPSLPNFNTDDPGARAHIVGSAVHWLRSCDVDGFRLDHAIGPGMDFWVAFRQATRAAKPDCLSVGEATDTPDCLARFAGRLDGVLDFVLARALRSTFGAREWDVGHLDGFLEAHEAFGAGGPGLVSFLDNHDMNRFLFVAGGDTRRLRLAALCQFSLAAVPVVYYGTEVGMGQSADIRDVGDAEARQDMAWDPRLWDADLLDFYRRLIAVRKGRPALHSGGRRRVHLDVAAGTYAYVRSRDHGDDVYAVFNLSPRGGRIVLPPAAAGQGAVCLLAAGPTPAVETTPDGLAVSLDSWSGALLGSA